MKSAHRLRPRYFHSAKDFANLAGTAFSFVCNVCLQIISFKDLDTHPCRLSPTVKRHFDCPFCDRHFSYQNQLEQHLCNGWCKAMTWLKKPTSEQTAKLYKVLTGIDLVVTAQSPQDEEIVKAKKAVAQINKKIGFDISDKQLLARLQHASIKTEIKLIKDLPDRGNIYCGENAKGINNYVKKEVKTIGKKLQLVEKWNEAGIVKGNDDDKVLADVDITQAGKNFIIHSKDQYDQAKADGGHHRGDGMKMMPGYVRTAKTEENSPSSLVIKVPPVQKSSATKPKKESKKDRRIRIISEIERNKERIKLAVDYFKVRLSMKFLSTSPRMAFVLLHFRTNAFSVSKPASYLWTPCFFCLTS